MVKPAFQTPPHLRYGAGEALGWVVSPPGGVVQLMAPTPVTRELAEWLVGPALQRMLDAYPRHDGYIVVLDLTEMQSREPAARAVVLQKARELHRRLRKLFIVPPQNTSPVRLATVHAAVALLSGLGMHVELARSSAEVIARMQLVPSEIR